MHLKGPNMIERTWLVGDVGEPDIDGGNVPLLDKEYPSFQAQLLKCEPSKKANI